MRIIVGLVIVLAHAFAIWILQRSILITYHAENPTVLVISIVARHAARIALDIPSSKLITPIQIELAPIPVLDLAPRPRSTHLVPPMLDPAKPLKRFSVPRMAEARNPGVSTVILLVEVLADGSVGNITVQMGTGSAEIDAAAMAYVRGLHWRPAVIDGSPAPMRVLYGVDLSG